MERAVVDGMTLDYEAAGTHEPVVFIHGAFIADAFRPLLAEPSLAHRFRLITYHRRGYAGSSPVSGHVSVAQQAADCRDLLRCLDVDRAHVVGHSFGGCVALQLALDFPEAVHTMTLLEPDLWWEKSRTGIGRRSCEGRSGTNRGEREWQYTSSCRLGGQGIAITWTGYCQEPLNRW